MQRLERSLELLREFDRHSEGGFLKLGETLRGVAGLSKRLAECAAEMAGAGGVLRYREAIGDFEGLVEELRGIRGGTQRHAEVLERIAGLVRAFRAPAREFARANRTFRLLGLYVRVEASRLRAEGAEFSSLADDIAALAHGIDDSAGSLEQSARQAGERLDAGSVLILELGREQSEGSGQMLELAAAEIAALGRRSAEAHEAAQELAEGCCRLRDEMGRIVTGLQFQDIARQRLEHVCEGLERLLEGLRRMEPDAGAGALAALEARQLNSAREELRSALVRIGDSLESAGSRSSRFGTEAQRLVAEPLELKACGETMTGTARDCSASLERLGEVVAEVLPVLEGMGTAAMRIDETGYRIGLVSLNCAVKTAGLGADGAALGVVAGEMGRLAMETGTQAAAVSGRLSELRQETGVLSELGAGAHRKGFEARVEAALRQASEAERECLNRLRAVRELAERLTAELSDTEEREEWVRRLVAGLDEACGLLGEVAREMAPQGADSAEGGGAWCEGLEHRYTMESEREIHQEYITGDTPQEKLMKSKTDATFGDGIELF